MKIKSTLVCIAILFATISYAQEITTEENSIDSQVRTLYKNSNNYQEYKVIKKSSYRDLQSNIRDSITYFKSQITIKNNLTSTQVASIDSLVRINTAIDVQLKEAINQIETILLFGFELKKNRYSLVLFMIILILCTSLLIFIYKFKNSNALTTEAKSNLTDVEDEFNTFRKKSLERQQKLRRELQDEILKNRNN